MPRSEILQLIHNDNNQYRRNPQPQIHLPFGDQSKSKSTSASASHPDTAPASMPPSLPRGTTKMNFTNVLKWVFHQAIPPTSLPNPSPLSFCGIKYLGFTKRDGNIIPERNRRTASILRNATPHRIISKPKTRRCQTNLTCKIWAMGGIQ